MTPRRTGLPPAHDLVMALRALDAIPDGPRFRSYDPHTRLYDIATTPHPGAPIRHFTADQARAYATGATQLTPNETRTHRAAAHRALGALGTLAELPYLASADTATALTAVRSTLQHIADQADAAHQGARDAGPRSCSPESSTDRKE